MNIPSCLNRASPNSQYEDDIVCQLLDWYPMDSDKLDMDSEFDIEEYDYKDTKDYVIRVFGKDETGISVSIKILGFKPYFYVEIPKKWTMVEIDFLLNVIQTKLGKKY